MRLTVIACAVALAGCNATMPQRPTAADDPSRPCFEGIPINPQLAAIAPKISLTGASAASLQMLSDPTKPTEQEKEVLALWAKYRAECVAAGRSFRARYAPPGWASAYEDGQLATMRAIAGLYGGSLTFGQFNMERQKIASAMESNLNAAADRADQRADVARGQALQSLQTMQLLQAMQPRPQPIMPLPMPPAPVYCNSNSIGNTVNTVCR